MAGYDFIPIAIDSFGFTSMDHLSSDATDLAWAFAAALSGVVGDPGIQSDGGIELTPLREEGLPSRWRAPSGHAIECPRIYHKSYGFGYGSTDISIWLSLAVITTYGAVVILYVAYIIVTGHTSIA